MQENKLVELLNRISNFPNVEIAEFRELVSTFDSEIVAFDKKLAALQGCIHSYKLPAKEDLDLVTESIEKLSEKYQRIYSLAQSLASSEEVHENAGVEDFICAVERSKRLALRAKVDEARAVLSRFCRIIPPSSDPKCIEIHQQNAQQALEKLSDVETTDVDPLLEMANGPKAFLDAFDCDSESDVFFDLLEKAGEFFGPKVQFLLTVKKFKEPKTVEQPAVAPVVEEPAVEPVVEEPAVDPVVEEPAVEPVVEEPAAVEKPASAPPAVAAPTEQGTVSALREIIAPSLKKFMDDVKPFFRCKIQSLVIPSLCKFGLLNASQINKITKRAEDVTTSDLQLNEGSNANMYAAYECVGEDGEADKYYCLTQYCYDGLKKNKEVAKKALLLAFSQGGLVGKQTLLRDVVESHLKKNKVLFAYFDELPQDLDGKKFKKIVDGVVRKRSSYGVPVLHEDREIQCYLLLDASAAVTEENENVLVVARIMDIPQEFNGACKNVYVAKNGKIYKCDPKAGSVSEQVLEQETRPEPKPEPETEPEIQQVQEQSPVDNEPADDETPLVDDTNKEAPPPPKIDASIYVSYDSNRTPIKEPTAQQLIDLRCKPEEDELLYVAENLLKSDRDEDVVIQSLLLAETASFEKGFEKCAALSKQIQLATHLFLDKSLKYSQEVVSSALLGLENTSKEISLAIYLQGMVTPVPHNYDFQNQIKSAFVNYDDEFADFPEFKSLYNILLKSLESYNLGFTKQVLQSIGSAENLNQQIEQMKKKAALNLVPSRSSLVSSHKLANAQFLNDPNCDMHKYVKWVEEGKHDKESLEELKLFLEMNDVAEELTIDKVELYVDECLAKVASKASSSHAIMRKFAYNFYKRFEVIKEWVDCFGEGSIKPTEQQERKESRDRVVNAVNQLLENQSWKRAGQGKVLEIALNYIKMYLTSSIPEKYVFDSFSELLKTGCISLDEDGMPLLDCNMTMVRFNEPWLYALRHIVAEKKDFDSVRSDILTHGKDVYSTKLCLFDSLHQLDMIALYLNRKPFESEEIRKESWSYAREEAERKKDKFLKDLELGYTYGQFGEREKEVLLEMVSQYQDSFYERGDFAQWGWFLEGLEAQKTFFAVRIGNILKEQLDSKYAAIAENPTLEKEARYGFLKNAKEALGGRNYALVEEYINRYDRNVDVSDYDEQQNAEKQYFGDFLSSECIDTLVRLCKANLNRSIAAYGTEYLKEHSSVDIQAEKSDVLLSSWLDSLSDPVRKLKIGNLFKTLGFEVEGGVEERGKSGDSIKHFVMKVVPVDKSLHSYKHPITNYGTGMSSINVLFTNKVQPADDFVDEMYDYCVKASLRSINTIVLIDLPLDSNYRRRVSDLTHTSKYNKNPFLLVDPVLMIYLAGLRRSERITAMLQCTLPYSTYQPFCDDNSSSGIGDEMFFGREEEIEKLASDNPPCFVYGGRQLGKTTLLLRATNLCHKQELKDIAVYVDIKTCDTEDAFVSRITDAINVKLKTSHIAQLPANCKKISTFISSLEKHIEIGKINSLFLLMDESDNYLDSISKDNYGSLGEFIALKRRHHNKFRFVFAGLHNVSRAKNAFKDNSVLGQFGQPLCVRPLGYRDASNLLLRPLRYLGFKIAKYPYLDSILANTNYYPGMIQFFGNILVKNTLIEKYSYTSSSGCPPFILDRSQLSKVIASADLNKSIQDKFEMSLKLDNRYLMLARCITALYHLNDKSNMIWMGFSIDEIRDVADNVLNVKALAKEEHYEDLLNEMVDMGILELTESKYRLRRRAFVDMIGSDLDKIEHDVNEANATFEKKHGK